MSIAIVIVIVIVIAIVIITINNDLVEYDTIINVVLYNINVSIDVNYS